jgi:hypothetical protein
MENFEGTYMLHVFSFPSLRYARIFLHVSNNQSNKQEGLKLPELSEARRIIGNSVIDRNEELHQEVETLLDILRNYNADIEKRKQAQLWRSRLARDFRKDQLEQEIRNFIGELRNRTSDPVSLRPSTARERKVVSYFVDPERPRTAQEILQTRNHSIGRPLSEGEGLSQTGSKRDIPNDGRPRTADLVSKALSETSDVVLVCERLESIAGALRDDLAIERDLLLEDISFLHQCIESEIEREVSTDPLWSAPPTEAELLDLKGRIQVCSHCFQRYLDV